MVRLGWVACCAAWLLSTNPTFAANVTIEGENPREGIKVVIDDASVDFVLESLREKYGFDLGGRQNARVGEPLSATMSGTLEKVLSRLLRNRNYVIVRSTSNKSGIDRITIIDASYGSLPPKAVPSTPVADDSLKTYTGEN